MIKRNTLLSSNGRNIESIYQEWLEKAGKGTVLDSDIVEELQKMENDTKKIEEAFYRNLSFGTGGIRGILGAGPNRINVNTVAKVSQGLSNFVVKNNTVKSEWENRNGAEIQRGKIAVSYDSRNKSYLFAQIACQVFAANGIKAYIYHKLMPTPCLSFAVRQLECDAGVMITASHNPSEYNGYKVYGSDGCQITMNVSNDIYEEIEKVNIFEDVKIIDFQEGIKTGDIEYISQDVYTAFIEAVKLQSFLKDDHIEKGISVVYSPLNGTGLEPVVKILKESGYVNVTVVKEQKNPDGNFPTCPNPNPEEVDALALGIKYAKKNNASLVLATDPDCDRVGVAVRNNEGKYVLLSGNETGVLLFDYICNRRIALSAMPKRPVMAKTIVTTEMGKRIADQYGVETINVLTGFKFIGEQIGILETKEREKDFIFGFEESYGYLGGSYVRDKDGVWGALLICEMCSYYASKGMNLIDRLEELYDLYGFYLDSLHVYKLPGIMGEITMKKIMDDFRKKHR